MSSSRSAVSGSFSGVTEFGKRHRSPHRRDARPPSGSAARITAVLEGQIVDLTIHELNGVGFPCNICATTEGTTSRRTIAAPSALPCKVIIVLPKNAPCKYPRVALAFTAKSARGGFSITIDEFGLEGWFPLTLSAAVVRRNRSLSDSAIRESELRIDHQGHKHAHGKTPTALLERKFAAASLKASAAELVLHNQQLDGVRRTLGDEITELRRRLRDAEDVAMEATHQQQLAERKLAQLRESVAHHARELQDLREHNRELHELTVAAENEDAVTIASLRTENEWLRSQLQSCAEVLRTAHVTALMKGALGRVRKMRNDLAGPTGSLGSGSVADSEDGSSEPSTPVSMLHPTSAGMHHHHHHHNHLGVPRKVHTPKARFPFVRQDSGQASSGHASPLSSGVQSPANTARTLNIGSCTRPRPVLAKAFSEPIIVTDADQETGHSSNGETEPNSLANDLAAVGALDAHTFPASVVKTATALERDLGRIAATLA